MKGYALWTAVALLLLSSCSPKVFPVQRDTVTLVRTEIVERLVPCTVLKGTSRQLVLNSSLRNGGQGQS